MCSLRVPPSPAINIYSYVILQLGMKYHSANLGLLRNLHQTEVCRVMIYAIFVRKPWKDIGYLLPLNLFVVIIYNHLSLATTKYDVVTKDVYPIQTCVHWLLFIEYVWLNARYCVGFFLWRIWFQVISHWFEMIYPEKK